MTNRPEPDFREGDAVRIVDDPFEGCPFDWAYEMDDFCGEETVITGSMWFEQHGEYGYFIAADNGDYTWCRNCFAAAAPDIEESDEDISTLFE